MAQRDDLRAEAVHAGQHERVGAGGRDVRAVGVLEQDAVRGEPVDVRRGQARIAVTAHVVRPQAVDAEEDDVVLLHTGSSGLFGAARLDVCNKNSLCPLQAVDAGV